MVSDDNGALHFSVRRSLMDLSSSSSQAVCVRAFWACGFGGGLILSKSSLLSL